MPTIFIENKPYEVKDGHNLLQACLSLGFELPYFCWHPAMHSVGSCRQCAVKQFKDENDTRGRIIMACMTAASDGMRISIDDPEAVKFRKSTIEWLMLNHPHDCPVCDEGGECHLQDMTVMTGHIYRRTRTKKRTYRNQYLGPFVNHEMNRCIQCYRCVRFYNDYAGGRDFGVFASHHHIYFGRHKDGVLESEFSGNLIEICPTGVFTDKTLVKHYTRKWDLQTAPSVCIHCGLGCNIIPGERYGTLRRVRNRYNGAVNGYFICDRGRFGYEFVNSEHRVRSPLLARALRQTDIVEGAAAPSKETVIKRLADLLHFGSRVIGIGSPRASLEANFALRTLVGPEHFYHGLSEKDFSFVSLMIEILQKGPARSVSLREAEECDAVLILGEDVTNAAPMLDLSMRQSVRQKPMRLSDALGIPRWHDYAVRDAIQRDRGPLFIASHSSTKLDDVATGTYRAAPDDIARLGFAIASIVDPEAPGVADLTPEAHDVAVQIARTLTEAEKPLIVSGMSCGSEAVIRAAANVAWSLCKKGRQANLCFTVPECNTIGLGLMGGAALPSAFKEVRDGKADTVIILESDLYRRTGKKEVDEFFSKIEHIIVIDCMQNATTSRAEIVLPAGTYVETDGTLVNSEGRAQRSFKVMQPAGVIQESWRWVLDMMTAAEKPEAHSWKIFEDITVAMSEALPVFRQVVEIAPPAGFRISGMKIPRQPQRYSGRTAMNANISVHEPEPPIDPDSPLSFSMEGYEGMPPSPLISRFWRPAWNSVQALNKFQSEIGGALRGGDPGRRLIEADSKIEVSYFQEVPEMFRPDSGKLLVLPLYHIFGSEEFSAVSPAIAELAPKPYLGLRPEDIDGLKIRGGEEAVLTLNDRVMHLPIKVIDTLPVGAAALPFGLPGLQDIFLPSWGKVSRFRNEGAAQ
jgi:NADH-quinone oxidoreductase subunit G